MQFAGINDTKLEFDAYKLNKKSKINFNNIEFITDKDNYNQYSDTFYLYFGKDKNVSNEDKQLAILSFARLERVYLRNIPSEILKNLKDDIDNNKDNIHMIPEVWVYHKKGVYTYVKSISVRELKKYVEQIAK